MHFWGYLEARVESIINPLGTLLEDPVECSVFCVLCNDSVSRVADSESRVADGESRVVDGEGRVAVSEGRVVDGEGRVADCEAVSGGRVADSEAVSEVRVAVSEGRVVDGEGRVADSEAVSEGQVAVSEGRVAVSKGRVADMINNHPYIAFHDDPLSSERMDGGAASTTDADNHLIGIDPDVHPTVDATDTILDGESARESDTGGHQLEFDPVDVEASVCPLCPKRLNSISS